MKKALFLLLTLVFSLAALSCALAGHDHIDEGLGYVMYNSYVAPTETEDGSTGPGTCSVCGAVVEPASRIPKIATQREVAGTPIPTTAPTAAPTPVLTAVPTQVPTAVPTPAPTAVPTSVPAQVPAQSTQTSVEAAASESSSASVQSSSPHAAGASEQEAATVVTVNDTPIPAIVTSPPAVAETAVPAQVTAPPTVGSSTPVPERVTISTSSESAGLSQPTAQPDLTQAVIQTGTSGASSGSNANANITTGSGSGSGTATRSYSAVGRYAGRDLARYPIFSNKFPWRRLRMIPQEGIIVRYAGRLLWPIPEAKSPLQMLLQTQP